MPDPRPASITISAGVSLEEALLLCQTWENPPEPFFTQISAPTPAPVSIETRGPRLPEMAAVAEVAASLVRLPMTDRTIAQPEPPPVETRMEARPEIREISRGDGQTFWSFG